MIGALASGTQTPPTSEEPVTRIIFDNPGPKVHAFELDSMVKILLVCLWVFLLVLGFLCAYAGLSSSGSASPSMASGIGVALALVSSLVLAILSFIPYLVLVLKRKMKWWWGGAYLVIVVIVAIAVRKVGFRF